MTKEGRRNFLSKRCTFRNWWTFIYGTQWKSVKRRRRKEKSNHKLFKCNSSFSSMRSTARVKQSQLWKICETKKKIFGFQQCVHIKSIKSLFASSFSHSLSRLLLPAPSLSFYFYFHMLLLIFIYGQLTSGNRISKKRIASMNLTMNSIF